MNRIISLVVFVLAVSGLVSGPLQAAITLPKILGSNMVLQRNKPVPIWGQAAPGEQVTVTFGKQVKTATANPAGQWRVVLDPMPASATPSSMLLAGASQITLENILVGEVWLCSGQSNMEYTLNKSSKHAAAVKSQGLTKEALEKVHQPAIRVFLVRRDLNKPGDINKGWQEASYQHLKDFSAAGYFFAEKLQNELHIPVGVISSAVPGSRIEPWISPAAFAAAPELNASLSPEPVKVSGVEVGKHYSGMIAPLAPFALRGFLWYQGESNCFLNETKEYHQKMTLLINSWRQVWQDEKARFYFVQLAPFYYSQSTGGDRSHTPEGLPEFREAQAAALTLPHTEMVVTTDLADKLDDIHPSYKWEIGQRLARVALANTYGQKKTAYSGPRLKKAKLKKTKVLLTFNHRNGGLVSQDNQPLTWFTIAGMDGKFVAGTATIKKNKIAVTAPGIKHPVAVRFAWHEAAQPNLYNKAGLPATPFRTDRPAWLAGKAEK